MIPANNHPEIDRLIHLKNHLGGMTMSKLISYQFNIDTACVDLQRPACLCRSDSEQQAERPV